MDVQIIRFEAKRCVRIATQVYVVVSAGSVIAFVVRDLGEMSISGWIIQVKRRQDVNIRLVLIQSGATLDASRSLPNSW